MFKMCQLDVLVHVVPLRTKAVYISELHIFILSMIPVVLKGYFIRAYYLTLHTAST